MCTLCVHVYVFLFVCVCVNIVYAMCRWLGWLVGLYFVFDCALWVYGCIHIICVFHLWVLYVYAFVCVLCVCVKFVRVIILCEPCVCLNFTCVNLVHICVYLGCWVWVWV